MHYAGLILITHAGRTEECAAHLRRFPDLTVYRVAPERCRIVAVLEGEDHDTVSERMHGLLALPGVVSVHPAYLYDDADEPEPTEETHS